MAASTGSTTIHARTRRQSRRTVETDVSDDAIGSGAVTEAWSSAVTRSSSAGERGGSCGNTGPWSRFVVRAGERELDATSIGDQRAVSCGGETLSVDER